MKPQLNALTDPSGGVGCNSPTLALGDGLTNLSRYYNTRCRVANLAYKSPLFA